MGIPIASDQMVTLYISYRYLFKNITNAGYTSELMFEWMVEDFVWLNERSCGMVAYDDDCDTVHVI